MPTVIRTADLEDASITAAKVAGNAVTAGKLADGAVDTSGRLAASVVTSAALAAAAVTAGKIAAGGVSASDQFAAAVVNAAAIAANAVDDTKLAAAVQNVLPDRLRQASYVKLTSTQALGTAQPLSLTDALFAGKAAGGSIAALGTSGVVAVSFATITVETGVAAAQGGLGSAAAADQPYSSVDFAGQNDVVAALQNNQGDDLVLRDMLSTASGADVNAKVYGYLSFRSDLAANLKWRLWFYYRRASDGLETPFTPDIAVANATLLAPEVFLVKDLPVRHGLNAPTVGSQAAAAVGVGGIGTSELAALAVTSAKLGAGAVIAGKIAAGGISAADQFAAGVVDSAALGAAAVTAGKIAVGGVSAANQFAAGVVDPAALAGNAVTFGKLAVAVQNVLGRYDSREDFTAAAAQVNFDLAVSDADSGLGGHLVYKNGLLQRIGAGEDYVFTDNGGTGGVDRVTFNAGLLLNDKVSVIYGRTRL